MAKIKKARVSKETFDEFLAEQGMLGTPQGAPSGRLAAEQTGAEASRRPWGHPPQGATVEWMRTSRRQRKPAVGLSDAFEGDARDSYTRCAAETPSVFQQRDQTDVTTSTGCRFSSAKSASGRFIGRSCGRSGTVE